MSVGEKAARYIFRSMNNLREQGEFCDLVLELKNTKFFVHRLVIAAWSLPLKNLLHRQLPCTQRIQISYDKPDVFHQFVIFLYTGTFMDLATNIPAVLLLARTFQIQMLVDLCSEQLKSDITVDNVISLHHLAIKFRLQDLELHCVDFLKGHLSEVAHKQELRELTPAQINQFLGTDFVSKLDPEMKLFLIISWLTEDVTARQQFLVLLLGHIDWPMVAKDFLEEISQTENFFTSNPSSLYLLLQTLHSSSISLGPYSDQFQSLREQYNYLLGSVVSSSVELGVGPPPTVQPIRFSLVSKPSTEQEISPTKQCNKEMNTCEVPDHLSDSEDEFFHFVNSGADNSLFKGASSQISSGQGGNDSNSNAKYSEVSKSPSNNTGLTISEGSTRRKCLRPRKIVSEPDEITADPDQRGFDSKPAQTHKTKSLSEAAKKGNKEDRHKTRIYAKLDPNQASKSMRMRHRKQMEERWQNETIDGAPYGEADSLITEPLMTGVIKEETVSEEEANTDDRNIRKRTFTQMLSGQTVFSNAGKAETSSVRRTSKRSKKAKQRKEIADLRSNQCQYCDFTSDSQLDVENHIKEAHKNRANCLFCCGICSFKTKMNREYYDHMRSHFPGPPYQCDDDECTYSSTKFQDLLSHRRLHGDQRPFVCDICLVAFRSMNNLYAHFKIHSDEKKFKCTECDRSFKFKNTLEQHLVTHTDLRPYLCDLCGFSTKFQSHLISHKKTHTGDVYKCTFPACAYTTPKRSQLKAHMRSHLGIRRHVCSTCGKAFVEKSHLVRHERIHSSERGYVCTQCEYSTTRADKLREHVQKHHSEDGSKPKTSTASKKQESHRKEGAKKNSYDNSDMLKSNQDSLIEVVVVKDGSSSSRPVNRSSVRSCLTGADIDATLAGMHFQPLQAESPSDSNGRIISSSLTSAPEPSVNVKSSESSKNEKELSTAEALARMGVPVTDTRRETLFPNQGQLNVKPGTGSSTGSRGVTPSGKTTADQSREQSSRTIPPYSVVMTPSHFSVPSSDTNTLDLAPQQPYLLPSSSHPFIMIPNMRSSSVPQHYYHGQQQGTQQEQNQQQQHLSAQQHFPNVGDFLF